MGPAGSETGRAPVRRPSAGPVRPRTRKRTSTLCPARRAHSTGSTPEYSQKEMRACRRSGRSAGPTANAATTSGAQPPTPCRRSNCRTAATPPAGQRTRRLDGSVELAPFLAHAAGSDVLSVVVAGAESAVLRLRMDPLLSAFASRRPRPEAPGLPARALRPGDRPRHHGRPARPEGAPAESSRPEPAHSSPR